ncbi:MAG: ribosomal protein S18-alanine N-acetyltransferase [Betaproteobacteria bacterium]|nr:ribosomal protein S18-alanine N-acetyltransferase [Betaproteobacteria bacterium]
MTWRADAALAPELFLLAERDLPWLCELEKRVNASPWQARHFADSLEAGHDAWGARRGGACLGFVLALHEPDISHLLNIAVAPEAQRQGLGAFLLRHAMTRAARTGAGEMFLEARPSNSNALSLYQSFGFQQVALRTAYYSANADNVREDALILRATLPILEET